MCVPDIRNSDSRLLAEMMDPDPSGGRGWHNEDLGAILRHQLSAPVQFDLGNLAREVAQKLRMLSEAEGLLVKSFGDLLGHPNPPIELLEMTKDFAKACASHPDSPLPKEIASLLYFASIVVALTRRGERISQLSDVALRRGIERVMDQPWLHDKIRRLLQEGLNLLAGEGSTGS